MAWQTACPVSSCRKNTGFTLVELVMVIILIGVLSVVGIGLFTSRSAFSPLLASQQLSSAILLAQQAALAGNMTMRNVNISQSGDSFIFDVGSGPRFEMERAGASLAISGAPLPFTVIFDKRGFPADGMERQFIFAGDSIYHICLSPLGAVYQGKCE